MAGFDEVSIDKSILKNNLFMVDLHPESVEIAKLSLWLKTARKHQKLNNLDDNIKCGNSLIDDPEIAGDKAFDWEKEFLMIFQKYDQNEGFLDMFPFSKGVPEQSEGGVLFEYPKLQLPFNPKLKEKARELRKAGNLSEVILWNNLKNKQLLGYDFTRQQIIGNYIVDFYCPKLRLVIEIDGESHDFKSGYDLQREKYLQGLGLNILHFTDLEVKKVTTEVVDKISNYVKKIIKENTKANSSLLEEYPESREGVSSSNTPSGLQPATPLKKGNVGFDVIVGNPPYVRVKKEDYPMYEWNTDLYLMFFEKILKHGLLKQGGYLGFIVPRYWMVNKENKSFRYFLLTQVDIISLSETVPFEDAETENVVVIIKNSPKKGNKIKVCVDVNKKFIHKGYIKISDCLKNKNYEILTHSTEDDRALIEKIERSANLLKNIINSKRGAEVGKNFLRKNEGIKSLIGQDVDRYCINFENTFLPENHKENIRLKETFNSSQIYLRRVANRLIATAGNEKFAFNKNIYGIWLVDQNYDYKFILACLNSDILSWYYKTKFSTKKIDLFPEIQTYLYEQLPIPKATPAQQAQIAQLVDEMMDLKKQVQEKVRKFLKLVGVELLQNSPLSKRVAGDSQTGYSSLPNTHNTPHSNEHSSIKKGNWQPTKKLEKFYELTFVEFLRELEKQK